MCITTDRNYCSEGSFTLSKKQKEQFSDGGKVAKLVEKAIDQLYDDRSVDKPTRKQLFESHFKPLKAAIEEGFGRTVAKVEYGTPNYEMLKNLQVNTAVFAIFKNHSSMKEMAALLKDEQGNLRSRDEFKREALKVDEKYRGTYLDTEYDTAVRTSRMAAIWAKAQESKRIYPNLRYVRSRAAEPRKSHEAWVGIVRPIDDPFWNTHMPPNGWKCQCSVEPSDDPVTDVPDDTPPVDKGFDFNSGKTGQAFDLKNSGYLKNANAKEQPQLIREAEAFAINDIIKDVAYQPIYQSKSGGRVDAHPLAFDNTDFNQVLSAARRIANQLGEHVKILPDVQNKDLRELLTPKGAKPNKNPDYLIGKKVADLKVLEAPTEEAVRGAIERCYKQCDNLLLSVPESLPLDKETLRRYMKGKLNVGYKSMQEVWIEYNGKWNKLTRERILKDEWF